MFHDENMLSLLSLNFRKIYGLSGEHCFRRMIMPYTAAKNDHGDADKYLRPFLILFERGNL